MSVFESNDRGQGFLSASQGSMARSYDLARSYDESAFLYGPSNMNPPANNPPTSQPYLPVAIAGALAVAPAPSASASLRSSSVSSSSISEFDNRSLRMSTWEFQPNRPQTDHQQQQQQHQQQQQEQQQRLLQQASLEAKSPPIELESSSFAIRNGSSI
jgi:hypothetical protein